jgi:DNA helicase-2/ATP-dependent DNA helicase PcrA
MFTPFSGFNKTASGNTKTYTVGMKVKHAKFGFGTVIAVKNGGNTVNIAFEGQGIKELSASIAPLEIIKN